MKNKTSNFAETDIQFIRANFNNRVVTCGTRYSYYSTNFKCSYSNPVCNVLFLVLDCSVLIPWVLAQVLSHWFSFFVFAVLVLLRNEKQNK